MSFLGKSYRIFAILPLMAFSSVRKTPSRTFCRCLVPKIASTPHTQEDYFFKHSNTLFCNNIYMCALWVKCTKSTFHMFVVSYNNCFRILHIFPMRCSTSGMFAAANVNSCSAVLRKCIYSMMTRISRSSNTIIGNVANGDVYLLSTLRRRWLTHLYNF